MLERIEVFRLWAGQPFSSLSPYGGPREFVAALYCNVQQSGTLWGNFQDSAEMEISRPAITGRSIWGLGNDLQAVFLHQVQQLERGSGRFLLPDFPFLDRGDARIQEGGKDRLTDV